MTLEPTIRFTLTPETGEGTLHEAAAYLTREITRARVSNTACFALVTVSSYIVELFLVQALVDLFQDRSLGITPCGDDISPIPMFYEFVQKQAMGDPQMSEALLFKRAEDAPLAQWMALNQRLSLFRSLPVRAIWFAPRTHAERLAQAAPDLWAVVIDVAGALGVETWKRSVETYLQGYTVNAIRQSQSVGEKLDDSTTFFLKNVAQDAETLLADLAVGPIDDPDWLRMPLHFVRGEIFATLQEPGRAVQEFQMAEDYAVRCEHSPSILKCRLELARALVAFYQPQVPETLVHAADLLNEYLAQCPKDAQALYTRGLVRWLRRQPKQALRDWDQAAPLLPDAFDLHWMAGQAALHLRDGVRATAYLEHALWLNPTHEGCRLALRQARDLARPTSPAEENRTEDALRELLAEVDLSSLDSAEAPANSPPV